MPTKAATKTTKDAIAAKKPRLRNPVAKANAKYFALSPAKKRVAIAKDVLAIMSTRLFVPAGSYGHLRVVGTKDIGKLPDDMQVNEVNGIKCEGCAKAGLMMAHVLKENHLTVGTLRKKSRGDFSFQEKDIKKRLSTLFSKLQLDMIEAAYELRVVNDSTQKLRKKSGSVFISDKNTKLGQRCVDFGYRFHNYKSAHSGKILKAIMQNIIDNQGEFIP